MEFKESHTGLEDVLIEKEILCYCYAKHKKMVKEMWATPPKPKKMRAADEIASWLYL
jgi:hypothetical protein